MGGPGDGKERKVEKKMLPGGVVFLFSSFVGIGRYGYQIGLHNVFWVMLDMVDGFSEIFDGGGGVSVGIWRSVERRGKKK